MYKFSAMSSLINLLFFLYHKLITLEQDQRRLVIDILHLSEMVFLVLNIRIK